MVPHLSGTVEIVGDGRHIFPLCIGYLIVGYGTAIPTVWEGGGGLLTEMRSSNFVSILYDIDGPLILTLEHSEQYAELGINGCWNNFGCISRFSWWSVLPAYWYSQRSFVQLLHLSICLAMDMSPGYDLCTSRGLTYKF